MRVVYLKSALRDLEVIRTYIARDDAEAARRVVARIDRSVERLANFPYSGRPGHAGPGSFPCLACPTSSSIVFKTKR